MQDIAKGGAVTKSGATRIVSRLEEKKLIIAFALNVFVIAIAAGYLVDILLY